MGTLRGEMGHSEHKAKVEFSSVTKGEISGDIPGHSGIYCPDSECEQPTLPGTSALGVRFCDHCCGVSIQPVSMSTWT